MKSGCSYFGNRFVRHAAKDMQTMARQGFDFVIHTMSEFDLMFHEGNMKDIVAASHDAGLAVHMDPWGVGHVFGGEPFSGFAARNIHEAGQVLDDGRPAALACPNAPLFREYMTRWIEAAVGTGADLLFWDEPHFHNPQFLSGRKGRWGCRCSFCREKFAASRGKPMPIEETGEVRAFKAECLLDFLRFLLDAGAQNGRKSALYLSPETLPAQVPTVWAPFADLPHLVSLGTGPYWEWFGKPIRIVEEYARALKKLCTERGLTTQIWIQACKVHRGREPEIAEAVRLAAGAGADELAAWAFDGAAQESWISCEDPAKAWAIFNDAMSRVKQQIGNPD